MRIETIRREPNTPGVYQECDDAERRLESLETADPQRLEKSKGLYACGLSLKGYRELRALGFGTESFQKAAFECIQ
jgi:hypothetical protein